jgi:hypothetical protein
MMSKKVIKWHDLIGLALTDLFKGSNFEVKTEQNMSVKPQYVDVLIISKSNGKPIDKLPDGFEFLADYNILTYKSLDQIYESVGNCRSTRTLCQLSQNC